jgi:hypothetical protein
MNWFLFFLLFPISISANPARKTVVHKDEVITVKTALGIATIIQVPDQPTSVVLGDSAAFKVEYLNQAITIKPLHGHATSNLCIHTDYARYSVKLIAGSQGAADYVVYLTPFEPPKPKSAALDKSLRWKNVGIKRESKTASIMLKRIAKTPTTAIIEFEFTFSQDFRIDPGSFWLIQSSGSRPINELLLSTLDAKKSQPVSATLIIQKSDLKPSEPARMEIRFQTPTSFQLSKEMLWKN